MHIHSSTSTAIYHICRLSMVHAMCLHHIWSHADAMMAIEKIQKSILRIVLGDLYIAFEELLDKCELPIQEVQTATVLVVNHMAPRYIHTICFSYNLHRYHATSVIPDEQSFQRIIQLHLASNPWK